MENVRITEEMLPALQGIIPSVFTTASKAGIPNISIVSQVFYVDNEHVAISWQYLNKSWANLQENPNATVYLTEPAFQTLWLMRLQFVEVQNEGDIFEEMDLQLQALSAYIPQHIEFKLKSAIIFKVTGIEMIYSK